MSERVRSGRRPRTGSQKPRPDTRSARPTSQSALQRQLDLPPDSAPASGRRTSGHPGPAPWSRSGDLIPDVPGKPVSFRRVLDSAAGGKQGLQKSFGDWTTFGGGGLWLNRSVATGDQDFWFFGWALQRKVTEKWSVGGEIFHATADKIGGKDVTGFNLGALYRIDDHHQFLFSTGRGI